MGKLFLIAMLLPFAAWADKSEYAELQTPWFTGPLIAPSAFVIPVGHYYFEPYLFATANTGFYNGDWEAVESNTLWNNFSQTLIQVGLTKWMDFVIYPTVFYNYTRGAAKWELGDFPFGIDMMFYARGKKASDWITAIKLQLKETFPIGKYRNLNPHKKGTDVGGEGTWLTSISLDWGQTAHVGGGHFFSSRVNLTYNLPTPVKVRGFNAYGGGYGTKGTVYPSQSFAADLGMELSLTQNWVLACDLVGVWSGKVSFKGNPGIGADGLPAKVGSGSSVQYSIAPAIEYNWSRAIGIIIGPWFTIGGRNSIQFFSGVFAFSYYL